MVEKQAGFEEREHPADISIHVWAQTMEELFAQSAKGMNALIKPQISRDSKRLHEDFVIRAIDPESLLVAFLSELIFCIEEKRLIFNQFDLSINDNELEAELEGRTFDTIELEIKAVTYSDLDIEKTDKGFKATLVFDI